YAWQPPCLSLGYSQSSADVDKQRLHANGWDLVRRPTGGKAILHTDELTYSVNGPHDDPRLAGSVLESYSRLSQALLNALHLLNIPAEASELAQDAPAAKGAAQGPVCFEVPSNYEITVSGKKLIGSAQARRKEGVLQHGSLPLYGDLGRITQALVYPDEESRSQAAIRLLKRATTVEQVLNKIIAWEDAAQAMAQAFQETLNIELQPASLTSGELQRAGELLEAKYNHPAWTERV
ncbi:MAG: lipoate--protein ligase family protein, partial [Chloroflexota bacterium]